MGDTIQLEPFYDSDPRDEEERRRRALDRLTLPRAEPVPTQEDVEAQAMGDAYRAMPDAEADAIQARSRDTGPGGRVYAAGDIPPSEPQRQRMMDASQDAVRARVVGDPGVRPRWRRPIEDPRAELDNDRVAQRPESLAPPQAQQLIDRAPTPTTTPAGGAASPSASPPAGRDHTRADVFDAIARVANGLANATAALGPMVGVEGLRGAQPFQSQGDRERAEDRALAEARSERDARQRERHEALRMRQQQAASTDMYRQRQLEIQDQLAQGRLSEMQAREAIVRNAAEEQRAMRDPDSALSQSWRQSAIDRFRMLPPQLRGQMTEDRFARMTGEEAQRFLGGAPRVSGGVRTSGAGGGGVGRTPDGQLRGLGGNVDVEQLIRTAVEHGIPEPVARVMAAQRHGVANLTSAIATQAREDSERAATQAQQAEQARAGVEIMPGVVSHLTNPIGDVETRAMRDTIDAGASHSGALREIERITAQYGASARIDPRAAADLAAPINEMLAMVAQMRNTGVINPGEMESIQSNIPNPESLQQLTFGEVQRRVGSFRRRLEETLTAKLSVRGVDEAGVARALSFLRTGHVARERQQQTRRSVPQGMVELVRPDGTHRGVPADRVEAAIAAGWRRP